MGQDSSKISITSARPGPVETSSIQYYCTCKLLLTCFQLLYEYEFVDVHEPVTSVWMRHWLLCDQFELSYSECNSVCINIWCQNMPGYIHELWIDRMNLISPFCLFISLYIAHHFDSESTIKVISNVHYRLIIVHFNECIIIYHTSLIEKKSVIFSLSVNTHKQT